ncbi:DUF4145 domain-containing protein [Kitasatospora sp. NPDC058406]|uniref:DUF4145 domain-containing protein n=1 Tax=Kitasatospora sp. NPDC058406 TaxID=3346483 RepID=UPI0036519494
MVLACRHCSKTVVLHQLLHLTDDGRRNQVGDLRQAWPHWEPRELHTAAPQKVRDLFAEGARAESAAAYRAAGAMHRAAVEELCKDRGTTGNNLDAKIEDLANHGVTPEIVEDLHEARFLGNWSLHDGLEFSAAEVADVADLITEAVVVLYVQPAEHQAMRDARKARRDAFKASQ